MFINRAGKAKCYVCQGTGKYNEEICRTCSGYGSITLRKLEQFRKQINEGNKRMNDYEAFRASLRVPN